MLMRPLFGAQLAEKCVHLHINRGGRKCSCVTDAHARGRFKRSKESFVDAVSIWGIRCTILRESMGRQNACATDSQGRVGLRDQQWNRQHSCVTDAQGRVGLGVPRNIVLTRPLVGGHVAKYCTLLRIGSGPDRTIV